MMSLGDLKLAKGWWLRWVKGRGSGIMVDEVTWEVRRSEAVLQVS